MHSDLGKHQHAQSTLTRSHDIHDMRHVMACVARPQVCELRYSKATSNPARWVLAVREDSPVRTAEDLAGTIIASELVETTKK